MSIKSKIGDYTVSLNKRDLTITIVGPNCNKTITTKDFEKHGMRKFPKNLYKLICSELKYANIYDKFVDKYYNWEEDENT